MSCKMQPFWISVDGWSLFFLFSSLKCRVKSKRIPIYLKWNNWIDFLSHVHCCLAWMFFSLLSFFFFLSSSVDAHGHEWTEQCWPLCFNIFLTSQVQLFVFYFCYIETKLGYKQQKANPQTDTECYTMQLKKKIVNLLFLLLEQKKTTTPYQCVSSNKHCILILYTVHVVSSAKEKTFPGVYLPVLGMFVSYLLCFFFLQR